MKNTTFDLIFGFLNDRSRSDNTFTIGELSAFIKKKESTSKAYLSKKLIGVFVTKLARNLKAEIDEEKIEAFRGTESLPFEPGKRMAVKIIDDRGIESLKIITR